MSIKRTIEKYGPSIFSIIGTICLGILDFLGLVNHEAFKTFISEIITITSILIGFIGVLLGLIASIKNTPVFQSFLKAGNRQYSLRLKSHILSAMCSNFITIIISLVLLLLFEQDLQTLLYLRYTLIIVFLFALSSSIRIIFFSIEFLFSNSSEKDLQKKINFNDSDRDAFWRKEADSEKNKIYYY